MLEMLILAKNVVSMMLWSTCTSWSTFGEEVQFWTPSSQRVDMNSRVVQRSVSERTKDKGRVWIDCSLTTTKHSKCRPTAWIVFHARLCASCFVWSTYTTGIVHISPLHFLRQLHFQYSIALESATCTHSLSERKNLLWLPMTRHGDLRCSTDAWLVDRWQLT